MGVRSSGNAEVGLRSSGFVRNSLLMFMGAAGAQLITLLVMPLLTRLFSPEAIGVHALVVSWAGAATVLVTLRLDLAVVLPADDRVSARLWWLGFYQGLAGAFVIILLALVADGWLRRSFTSGMSSSLWVWLLAPMLIASVVTQMSTGLATRQGRFRLVAMANLMTAVVFAFSALLIGLLDPFDTGVVVARVVAATAGCVIFVAAVLAMSRHGSSWRARQLHPRRLWRDQRQFILFNTPYSLVGSVTRDLPLYVFAVGGGAGLAASYALARTVTLAPTTLVSAALGNVFYREASMHLGTPRLKSLALTLSRWGLVLTVPGFAFLTAWGDELFVLVFGETWRTAGNFSRILAVPLWLALQNGWPQRLFEASRRQNVSFTIQMCFDAAHALVVTSVYFASGNALLTIGAYAVTYSAFHITYLTAVFGVAGFGHVELRRIGARAALGFAGVASAFAAARAWSPWSTGMSLGFAVVAVIVLTAGLAWLLVVRQSSARESDLLERQPK